MELSENEDNPRAGASLLEGFQEALNHNPHVISVSLGFDMMNRGVNPNQPFTRLPNSLRALEAEIELAVANGVVVVFSAGNGHVAFPGMMPDVIAAGGVFVRQDGRMEAASYASAFSSSIFPGRNVPDFCGLVGLASNRADYIMLPLPPGCEIDRNNATHDGTATQDGWAVFSGTSAAAPQLAGVCALMPQKNPGLRPNEIKSVLRRTCRDVIHGTASSASTLGPPMAAGPGTDSATGAGLVNTFAALRQV